MKIGDRVIITQSEYDWRQVYVGKVGIIIGIADIYDWIVRCKDVIEPGPDTCWWEKDLELAVQVGEQLEFDFMKE